MIVARASTRRGTRARWSNTGEIAADRYLVAPGELVVLDCGTLQCRLTSGTSYSVSYAAGAIALLLSRNPDLSVRKASETLLQNARDIASRGADPLAGRGLQDVQRALRNAERASGDRQG